MKLIENDMQEMAISIKYAIELSVWTMFEVECHIENVKYLLETSDTKYFLTSSGSIIKIVDDGDIFEIHDRVVFKYLLRNNINL